MAVQILPVPRAAKIRHELSTSFFFFFFLLCLCIGLQQKQKQLELEWFLPHCEVLCASPW